MLPNREKIHTHLVERAQREPTATMYRAGIQFT